MKTRIFKIIAAVTLTVLALSSCGIKGPLRMPEEPKDSQQAAQQPPPPAEQKGN